MKRIHGIFLSGAILTLSLCCSKPDNPPPTPGTGTPAPSAVLLVEYTTIVKDTAIVGVPFSADATVYYTNGDGAEYSTIPISSATEHGLTATLQPGKLATGNGSFQVKISGTPTEPWSVTLHINAGIGKWPIEIMVNMLDKDLYDYNRASPMERIVLRTNKLLSMLSATELATVQQPFTKASAAKWWTDPLPCNGCHIGLHIEGPAIRPSNLSYEKQLAFGRLADAVFNVGIIGNGKGEFLDVLYASSTYLTNKAPVPTSMLFGDYYLAIFGTPSTTGTWALQYSGHNFAINYTYSNGQLIGATPSFRGLEPANLAVKTQEYQTTSYTSLEDERSAFAALLAGLTPKQRADAKLGTVFTDILLGAGKDDQFPATRQGIKAATLNAMQQQLLMNVLNNYLVDPSKPLADAILARYLQELPETYLSWSGDSSIKSFGDYIRIDGPSVWIEFICKPGVAFKDMPCFYTIWRDKKNDYGGL